MKKIIAFIIIISMFLSCQPFSVLAADDDFKIIKERIEQSLIKSHDGNKFDASWLGLIDNEGKFTDLNYGDKMGRFAHIERICGMAWQFALPEGKLYKQQEAQNKILTAFSFFTKQKYGEVGSNVNWYTNITVPRYMAEIVIALRLVGVSVDQSLIDIMTEHHFDVHLRKDGNAVTFSLNTSNLGYTNGLWERMAIVLEDESWVKKMYDYASVSWIDHASGDYGVVGADATNDSRLGQSYFGDGYYPDGSYLGHGPQHYVFGYGNQFLSGAVPLVSLAAGTKYQPSQEKLAVLVDILLESMRWLMRGDHMDFPAYGRNLSGSGDKNGTGGRISRSINYANHLLKEPNIPRREELEDFVEKLQRKESISYVTGNKHYWVSDLMAHHRDKYFVAVNMASDRKFKAEKVGKVGCNNYYIADGTTPIYVTGEEYGNALYAYDWDRLPGITTIQSDEDVPDLVDMSNTVSKHYGRTSFVGGASDGMYGVAAMDYLNDLEVSGRKAWFLFDDEFVALGSNIASKTSSSEVYTNLNQCSLDGAVTYSDGTEVKTLAAESTESPSNLKWVHHGAVGYVLPETQNAFISNKSQIGNTMRKGDDTYPYEKRDIFSMYINHGARPSKATYSYIAVPGVDADTVKAYAEDIPVVIEANTAKVQAVYHKKLDIAQIVFYEEGSVELSNGMVVGTDTPCVLMLKRQEGGMAVTVQNPRNEFAEITLYINEKFESDRAKWDEKAQKSSITCKTRNALFAGQSVQVNITSKLISNMSYNAAKDEIDFSGVIPTTDARYIFAKITNKNGESVVKSAEIKADSTYEFTVDALNFSAGKYTVALYCENDMEPLVSELEISKVKPIAPVIFPDTINHWVRDYAARLAVHGVIEGDEFGNCNPDETITLAELMKILIKTVETAGALETPYVQEGNWDESVMNFAKANGFIPEAVLQNGENPSRLITRQEMVTAIMQVADKYGFSAKFAGGGADIPADMSTANHWAYTALEKAFNAGIIHGDGTGIKPFEYSTRGECIKILDVIVNLVIK